MTAQLGAHEAMEVHEVLTCGINTINQYQLLRPHVKDQQLAQILDKQLSFITQEYNGLVQAAQTQGMGTGSSYQSPQNFQPTYGLDNPQTQSPSPNSNQLSDQAVASIILGLHKSGAVCKMMACLECAEPNLRRLIQQSAANCAEQAYEIWQYMNQKGYYQVPTMKQMTTNTFINAYGTAGMKQGMQGMETMQGTGNVQQNMAMGKQGMTNQGHQM